MFETCRG